MGQWIKTLTLTVTYMILHSYWVVLVSYLLSERDCECDCHFEFMMMIIYLILTFNF